MAYQLIYTSSPTSLTMGRTGFSTVARTADMPEKLSALVERCGSYDISSGVIYTHRLINYYSQTYHILTRLKDAGIDYTNRNNYIAHHLVLSSDEIEKLANPAEILSQWDGWLDSWTSEPKLISAPENLDKIVAKNTLPAKNWQTIFGDARKAALLADSAVYISANVSDAGTLLDLFSESLLLNVNAKDAWQTTFTTSISTSENPSDFNWRTITEGENSQATIDLTNKKSPQAPDNRASEYAQSGILNNREKLNLKVSAPPKTAVRFNVVENAPKNNINLKLIYIVSAIFTFLALTAIAYVVFSDSEDVEPIKHTQLPLLETNKVTENNVIEKTSEQVSKTKPKISLFDTINLVREKIEANKFSDALKIWNDSIYAQNQPSSLKNILDDIGSRADSLMSYSENVFELENPSESEQSKAIENISIARQALDIEGLTKKDQREAKWKTLNSKIAK